VRRTEPSQCTPERWERKRRKEKGRGNEEEIGEKEHDCVKDESQDDIKSHQINASLNQTKAHTFPSAPIDCLEIARVVAFSVQVNSFALLQHERLHLTSRAWRLVMGVWC
jgi:hypothetical protein